MLTLLYMVVGVGLHNLCFQRGCVNRDTKHVLLILLKRFRHHTPSCFMKAGFSLLPNPAHGFSRQAHEQTNNSQMWTVYLRTFWGLGAKKIYIYIYIWHWRILRCWRGISNGRLHIEEPRTHTRVSSFTQPELTWTAPSPNKCIW